MADVWKSSTDGLEIPVEYVRDGDVLVSNPSFGILAFDGVKAANQQCAA